MRNLLEDIEVQTPTELKHSELEEGGTYFILTKIRELEEFTFLGGEDIKLTCGTETFIIRSDKIFKL